MTTVTRKGQVTIPKPLRDRLHIGVGDNLIFNVEDNVLILKRKERKSLLSLGGIAKGRAVGVGDERGYTKKMVSKRVAKTGQKNG